MKKHVWLNFDFGLRGDYDSMFAWLDSKGAKECGTNSAVFVVDVLDGLGVDQYLKTEFSEKLSIDPNKDRIYISWLEATSSSIKIKGKFLFGSRKRSPWEGYSNESGEVEDSGQ